ncbi:quinolinate synthase A [Marivirga tractuosa]|uniref:Quinolinate synthase n=1 Tax=Marivirga tractuosa (strain ATCC 23168 / DSM 4126 / NBRC 15989 / NCIMB 1408 / VKM B-1430 / H-43) TaxID=643867 RepID=E4TR17_MARTH|nr:MULTISPECIES: quinolinate synthase NadA [Marivirga]ADR22698.1 quinolinate synthetase A [Marivirga tractuosa DSM 4126]WKV12969.1 quinolinate synthase NadA [Marivirga harenae]BDD16631.1 quinolinate synthase A [Marivirga tractuosa]|tara:strand:- start:86065 stop:87000 length:936 start_codon:yes stop_codon:yes gene_type:complete
MNIANKILELKKEKNAVLLAHYYQYPEIQEIADFVGDSLALSKKASETEADIIVFAGVHFMGETAKLLSPHKKVIIPDLAAGCSLADSCSAADLETLRNEYPDHTVVTYINCSAEVKALSDYVCTSSNAVEVINNIPKNIPIIFAPDKNLGKYLIKETGRDMVLWDGACVVHEAFSFDKLLDLVNTYPDAEIIAHPESEPHFLKVAHFVGSTASLLNYVDTSDKMEFIIATEVGILHEMQKAVPEKTLIPAPIDEDNTCACSECAFMKINTIQKIYDCLLNETPEILIESTVLEKARKPIEAMLEFSYSIK